MIALSLCLLAASTLGALAQQADTGADGDRVVFPYQEQEAPFKQYSGFLDVLPTRHIHYVYVESQGDPATDPVVFWTNGGPGCSGLLGFLAEMGPWRPHRDGDSGQFSLKRNPYSWNRLANMVFLEQPVGVGFSRSDIPLGDLSFGDLPAAIDNTRVVRKFFEKFPERRTNDFYLASESYGGHYVPQWALRVLADDMLNDRFRGVLIGNPYVNLGSIFAGGINALWGMQLIPLPLWEDAVKHGCADFHLNRDEDTLPEICFGVYDHLFNLNQNINPYALNYPTCPGYSLGGKATLSQQGALLRKVQATVRRRLGARNAAAPPLLPSTMPLLPRRRMYEDNSNEPGFKFEPCTESWVDDYLNLREVQEAMHVTFNGNNVTWTQCSDHINRNWDEEDFAEDNIPLYHELVNQGINVLIMSGDTDGVCSTHSTQDWVFQIPNTTAKHRWTEWSILEDDEHWQTAGYLTKFTGGLSFSTVRNAGHEVPLYRPAEAFNLFEGFLNGSKLFLPDVNRFDTTDIYYGLASVRISVQFMLHSPDLPVAEFLVPGNEQFLAFLVHALRHTLDRSGIIVRMMEIESVAEHTSSEKENRRLNRATTMMLDVTVRVDAEISFDMNQVVQKSTMYTRKSAKGFVDRELVVNAVMSSMGLPLHVDDDADDEDVYRNDDPPTATDTVHERMMISVPERKHQKLVDDHLQLSALGVKEKIGAVVHAAVLSGDLMDYVTTALTAEVRRPFSLLTAAVRVADLASIILSGYAVVALGGKSTAVEWDSAYHDVPFSDLTLSPTPVPGFLGADSTTPVFIFTQSSWIVVGVSALVAGMVASFVGFILYRRFFATMRYAPVLHGEARHDEEGGVEMTPSEDAY